MKFFTNKGTSKKLIIAILLVMTFNFISPAVSHASLDEFGGALFEPICQLLLGISDLVIGGLQGIFIGPDQMKYGGIDEIETDTYQIRYSPGIIFSGKVAGLKVNFVNASEKDNEEVELGQDEWVKEGKYSYNELGTKFGFDLNNATESNSRTDDEWYCWIPAKNHHVFMWKDNQGTSYTAVDSKTDLVQEELEATQEFVQFEDWWSITKDVLKSPYTYYLLTGIGQMITESGYAYVQLIEVVTGNEWTVYRLQSTATKTVTRESSALTLQKTVSTWYKALRAIALVGLLSVLVYVGIRILISSTGQEKAKYKKMIVDWLAAICILFVLQYIMVFIVEITQKITQVLSANIQGEKGEDILMSNLRNQVALNNEFSQMFSQLLIYLVLVIYTVMFTIQYLKRLVYMAFFTMIAPLIALTYPLDKIKDGQAQAFSTWIREYIFNALLQPMHLLLYVIFVDSAMSLVDSNPLYAVVAIGFLIPAEKFFRKMFGFEKASSASPLGAAAGGALVMNAINKMGQKSGKQAAGEGSGGSESGNKSQVRTVSSNASTIGKGNGGATPAPGGGGDSTPAPGGGGDSTPAPGGGGGSTPAPGGGGGSTPAPGGASGSFGTSRNANIWGPTMKRALSGSIGKGALAVGRKYINKNTGKKIGRLARKGLLGAAGAATLGTVGLAAGIATGDLGNAFKYGLGGAAAGYMGANNLGDNLLAKEKNLRETFKEGAIGQEEYKNLKLDKEFYESDEFRSMLNNPDLLKGQGIKERGKNMRNIVQVYRDNGITDTQKITTAMKSGLRPEEGAYAIRLAEMIGRSGWNNPKTREDFETRYKSKIPGGSGDRIWNQIENLL